MVEFSSGYLSQFSGMAIALYPLLDIISSLFSVNMLLIGNSRLRLEWTDLPSD